MNDFDTLTKRHASCDDPEADQSADPDATISNGGSDLLGYSGLDPCDGVTVDVASMAGNTASRGVPSGGGATYRKIQQAKRGQNYFDGREGPGEKQF